MDNVVEGVEELVSNKKDDEAVQKLINLTDTIFANFEEIKESEVEPISVDEFNIVFGPDLSELVEGLLALGQKGHLSSSYIKEIDKHVQNVFNSLAAEFSYSDGSRKIRLILISIKQKLRGLL